MMIPTLTDYYEAGYLPKTRYEALSAFFPNCNLSGRKRAITEVGAYDIKCRKAAEDADLCSRIADAGWRLFFESRAVCHHEARPNLRGLLKQWLTYGYHGAYYFRKRQRHRCEIYLSFEARPRIHRYRRILQTNWFPLPTLLFLSYFPLFHGMALISLIAIWAGHTLVATLLMLSLLVAALVLYRKSSIRRLNFKQFLTYVILTYLINTCCILGSIAAGLRSGRLYLYPGL